VHGTGEETRDFIHALDVARAIEFIYTTKGTGTYNVASGIQTPIRNLVYMLVELFRNKKEIHFNSVRRHGDPVHWQADISKLASLGFKASVSLEHGIRRYVDWYMKNSEIAR
jgi:UDP-glucose 4-epimerase